MPRLRTTTPMTPCDRLAAAQARLDGLMLGQSVTEVETPQLGRVQFSVAGNSISDLQRYIAALQKECAAYMGVAPPFARGPISIEVDP